jgi:hypothetical protein
VAKREMTEEQKAAARVNLAKAREAKLAKAAELPQETAPVEEPDESAPIELSDAELGRIREEAKKKVDAELAARRAEEKKAKMAQTLDAETLRLRREAGLTDCRDDILEILIDVAPFAEDLKIDGVTYQHGHWYPVDRRKYDVLREMMARSWDAEERAGNPNRKFRREVAGSMNPMMNERRLPDGTLTWGGAAATVDKNAQVVR